MFDRFSTTHAKTALKRIGLAASALALSCSQAGRGALSVDKESVDVGQVTQGQLVRIILSIKNPAHQPVTLQGSTGNCSCTNVTIVDSPLAATASTTAEVTIATYGIPTGPFKQRVQIDTNEPATPALTATVTGIIRAEFTPSVAEIDLGEVTKDSRATSTLDVLLGDEAGLAVTSAESTDPRLAVSIDVQQRGAGKVVQLKIQQLPNVPSGLYMGTIILSTSSKYMPTLRIPVRGRVL